MGALLALASAVFYGLADFTGGLLSRRAHFAAVALTGQVGGLILALAVAPLAPGSSPGAADLAWGALSGVGTGFGMVFLYRGLSRGAMSVVVPVSAVSGVALPVLAGVLLLGDRPSVFSWLGITVAVPALWLVAQGGGGDPARVPVREVAQGGGGGDLASGSVRGVAQGGGEDPVPAPVRGVAHGGGEDLVSGSVRGVAQGGGGDLAPAPVRGGVHGGGGDTAPVPVRGPGQDAGAVARSASIAALVAGVGVALQYLALARVAPEAGVWPVAAGRVAAILTVLPLALSSRARLRLPLRQAAAAAAAGTLAAGALVFYLLAVRWQLVVVAVVLSSLYPAIPVVLGVTLLRERLVLLQAAGLAGAAVAVAFLTAG